MVEPRTRIGFIIDGRFPNLRGAFAGKCGFTDLFRGCPSGSPVGFMRFGWIADIINRSDVGLHYELFKPWRRYDGVVFLKSMGAACLSLARRLKQKGVKILFDANVDYLTPAEGTFYYEGMAPSEAQRHEMMEMLEIADAVIADSEHIAQKCRPFHERVEWIPDNVNMRLVPFASEKRQQDRLTLLWSGASCKVFDILSIAPVLRAYDQQIRLVLVTDDWSGVERCFEPYRQEVKDLLADIEHEIIPFRSIRQLLMVYAEGDVFVSPRYLNNTYNQGHTEWKITLPMACGRFVLASPQPSYLTVHRRSLGKGLRICEALEDWHREINAILVKRIDMDKEGSYGRKTVETYYSTDVIARQHAEMIRGVIEGRHSL